MSINWQDVDIPVNSQGEPVVPITSTSLAYTLISTDTNLNDIFILCLIDGIIYEFKYNDISGMVEYLQIVSVDFITDLVASMSLSRYGNLDLLYITTNTSRKIRLYTRDEGTETWILNVVPIFTNGDYIINCMASTTTGNYLYCGTSSENITTFYFISNTYVGDGNLSYPAITLDGNKGRILNMVCNSDGTSISWIRDVAPSFFYKAGINNSTKSFDLKHTSTTNKPCNEQLTISKDTGKIIYAQSKYNLWEYDKINNKFDLVLLGGSNNENYSAISLDNTGLNSVTITSASISTNTYNLQYLPYVASSADSLKTSYNIGVTDITYTSSTVGLSCCVSPNINTNTNKPLVSIVIVASGSEGTILFSLNGGGSCFIKGTEISIFRNGIETVEKVENLKNGDLVKTSNNSFKPINFIGYNDIDIKRNMDYIYVLRKDAYKENVPNKDLLIVGGHSLLFDDLENVNDKFTPDVYVNNIDNYHKIMASQCSLCENASFEDIVNKLSRNTIKYYHFALENEDKDSQYAIYSNGMLSETMSINYSKKSGLVPLKSSVVNRDCC